MLFHKNTSISQSVKGLAATSNLTNKMMSAEHVALSDHPPPPSSSPAARLLGNWHSQPPLPPSLLCFGVFSYPRFKMTFLTSCEHAHWKTFKSTESQPTSIE